MTTIVIQSWAEKNGMRLSPRHFRTELRDSGCLSPVFRIKTDSVSEKIHLPFPALGFLEASLSFQKIALEIGFHTYISRFFVIFKVKGKLLLFMCKLKMKPSSSKARSWVFNLLLL